MATVAQLWRFPVKSMQGAPFERGELGSSGFDGDRRWGVIDEESGKVLSAKTVGQLLEASAELDAAGSGVTVSLPTGESFAGGTQKGDAMLSEWLDRPVRLERASEDVQRTYRMQYPDPTDPNEQWVEFPCPPGTFFDGTPVHLLTEPSLGEWDIRRFRPTVFVSVESGDSRYPEDEWNGCDVAVGGAVLRSEMLTPRCAMPMRAQPGGLDKDPTIGRTLKREHALNLGLYCIVTSAGPVAVGDEVSVVRQS
jgi:uncharacterized protein YcbX